MDQPDMLNLYGIRVLKVNDTESELDYYITAESSHSVDFCQSCGSSKKSAIVKVGKREYVYYDIPISGRRVIIKVNRQRFQCRECKTVFAERLHAMDIKRNATKRLVEWIQERALTKSFTSVADDVGVDEKTVRNIFKEYTTVLERKRRREIPTVMGVDEIHILGKRRFVITNIEERTLIDMLPGNDVPSLERYFSVIADRSKTKFITMDMYAPYRKMCRKMYPDAQIVVDKFHVLKAANYAIDMVRKRLRDNLTDVERVGLMHDRFLLLRRDEMSEEDIDTLVKWLDRFPSLNHAFTLKEAFYDIWTSENRAQAEKLFDEWTLLVDNELTQKEFKTLAKTVNKWRKDIFSYFDTPYTNALTESLNSVIRHIDRAGRGYTYEVLRVKVLFSKNTQKMEKPKVKKKEFRSGEFSHMMSSYGLWERDICYGTDIYTLDQLILEGKF